MDPSSLQALLLNLAFIAIVVAACVAASWLLSMFHPGVVRILDETRTSLLRVRSSAATKGREWIAGRRQTAQAGMRAEPVPPVALQLARVADAAETIGQRQLRDVEVLERRLAKSIDRLSGMSVGSGGAPSLEIEHLKSSAESTTGAFWKALLTAGLLVVFVVINSLVLIEFFGAVLSDRPLLPYPLPAFTIGHVFAAVFALAEVGSGMIAHRGRKKADADLTLMDSISRFAPYLVLFALGVIELFAYAVLSVNIRMPERLGIPATSAFYDSTRYFFAIFGPALTLLLAALGYSLWESVAEFWSGRNSKKVLRLFTRYDQMSKNAEQRVNAAATALSKLRDASESLPGQLRGSFLEAIGGSPEENAALGRAIYTRSEGLLQGSDEATLVRDERASIAVTSVNVLLLALWALLAFVFFQSFATLLSPVPAGWALAIAMAVVVAVLGFVIKDASVGAPYASLVHTAIPGRTGRRVFVVFVVAVLVVAAGVSAWVAAATEMLGSSTPLNAVLGVLLVAALAALSVNLDAGLVATWQALGWLVIGVSWLLLVVGIAISFGLEVVLYLAGQAIKVASTPGDWIRERFGRVATEPSLR